MRPLRLILLAAAALFAWRVFAGRARQAIQRARSLATSHPAIGRDIRVEGAGTGTHASAAAAANHDFWDDRDIAVGEKLSAVGMQPGAR